MIGAQQAADEQPILISDHVTENIHRALSAIRTHLKMDVAFVSEFLGRDRIFHGVSSGEPDRTPAVGQRMPLSAGYCGHIVAGRLPELIGDTRLIAFAQALPETSSVPVGAHIGVPVRLHERLFGTLCCYSHRPQSYLDDGDLELVRAFATMIASELQADLKSNDERQRKIDRLNAALSGGDPRMVFQPIVGLSDEALSGVEALARFSTAPAQTPDIWFAAAHDVNLGPELELLAVRKALRECEGLPAPFYVSVNISPKTIAQADIEAPLDLFDPERIVVEITKHVPVHDYKPILDKLAPLRRKGMRVAIDDAGAGYSSLRHVLALKPDIIKFDVSLTRNIQHNRMQQAMIAALSEFAQRTGTDIVAEGVETADELRVLRDLRIRKAQGYYFGRPEPLSDVLNGQANATLKRLASEAPKPAEASKQIA